LFRLVSQHVDEFLRVYDERFAKEHGPLRPAVERVLRGFIRCGIPRHGFARVLCDTCRVTYAVPFSCRTRSFCPSCEKKRALLWAEWVRGELLEAVAHRHVVFTIPRLLRPLFRRRRELLTELGHAAAAAIGALMQEALGARVTPGVVVCVATAGDLAQWHPHGHVLTTDGAYSEDGAFHPIEQWDDQRLMKLFREHLLARLVERRAISEVLVAKLTTWRHPGFSAFVGRPIAPEDKAKIEDIAAYLVKPPVSLEKLVYLDGEKAVLYRSKRMNPGLGRNFEAMDPLEWLARMVDHIPDPGKHRTLRYGVYSNRARGAGEPKQPGEETAPKRKRCTASWARLIHKVYGADPMICRQCGGKLRVIAFITDSLSIKQVLEPLGLWSDENQRPPPEPREVRVVPVDDAGREIGEAW
jgi:hypothetical protein